MSIKVYGFFLLLLVVLSGSCAPIHYGVSDDAWGQMTDAQRLETIKGYNEREKIRELRKQDEASLAQIKQEQLNKKHRAHIAAIYNGEAAHLGDLLRVSMEGGKVRINGKHRHYHPVSFTIADGEYKKVPLYSGRKYIKHTGELGVHYSEGSLLLDIKEGNYYGGAIIVYKPKWNKGKTYQTIKSDGPTELKNVCVTIHALPIARHKRCR
ncbi:hypothetical protein KAI46_02975 [bacterium]|nr:hypothetical protein [bacterium]